MKVETLKMQNIRSIKNLQIEFPESTVLFFGDIGSGKSSVLKAIEFALFGTMGELPGTSLLRRGEKKGLVELKFSIGSDVYEIHRELQKVSRKEKETVTQPKGWLIENGIKTSYTTTELRIKILDILKYSITNYKSSSKKCIDLYRYTVYTPQEEIKEILLAEPEERFDILKEVLEIEAYENTIKNLEKVRKRLMSDLRDLDLDIKSIGSPQEIIPEKEKAIEDLDKVVKTLKKEILNKKKEISKEKEEQTNIQEEYNEYLQKITEIRSKKQIIKDDEELEQKNEKTIKTLLVEIAKKQKQLDSLSEIKLMTKLEEEELDTMIKTLQEEGNTIRDEKTKIQKTINDVDKLLKKGKCSLCGQIIHEKVRFDKELALAKEKLDKLEESYNKNNNKVIKTEKLLKNLREYKKYVQESQSINELMHEKQNRNNELIETNKKLREKIELTKKSVEDVLVSYKIESLNEFKKLDGKFKEQIKVQSEKVENVQNRLTELEKNLSSCETEVENLKKILQDLINQEKYKEILKEKRETMNSIKEWVSDQLPILIKDIERSILVTTASEFNQYFKEWFKALVEDENIDIEISPEDFQPKVIMDGYESPFRDLSGGEKSALSLAYRLALNKVINTKFQEVKTKDLLILDEPTDGFSEQQVNKMQEVFEKLNTRQMIIISHERTLDSFVTDIFTFKKENHQTKVKKG